jgi:hypothetical protein
MSSALEQEFRRKAERFRVGLVARDRGVVIGAALSIVPVFPIALVGFLIDLFNLALYRAKKLEKADGQLARRAMVLSVIAMVISLILTYWLLHLVLGVNWSELADRIVDLFEGIPLLNRVIQHGHHGVQTI